MTGLTHGHPPPGFWAQTSTWVVTTADEAAAARAAARTQVAARETVQRPDAPLFASASARVETIVAELVLNGLQHAGAPVTVELSRGKDGWLVVVSDAAAEPPVQPAPAPFTWDAPGGLGLQMATAMASEAGWHADATGKHVWAAIGDQPPATLLRTLRAEA